ncbi:sporulation protein [Frateuria sp. Soil773]|uniref:SPOR domain-containing protein n=1 Tax=Frateuria sp. Soil773 TaxID=1736407 RepID=UPI0006FD5E24|nr:SPOR domain-containing protein [Frateuria sp. Soil773]KRF01829.1 sporulation protein [Frateuria sp. Soil773]
MFLRLLFVLLIALNIAVGAWLLLGQDDAHGRSATDPGMPELKLLSERSEAVPAAPASGDAAASTVAPPAAPAPAPVRAGTPSSSYSCLTLGPFAAPQDLRTARQALAAQSARMRSRQEQTTQTRGWWVHLPASGNRAQALELARRLEARHIGDYFVVSSGDQSNTVSLGLFKDPANARKRRDEVVAAGFPAQMSERTETVPEYWLDLAVTDRAGFDWRSRIRNASVGSHSTGCF